MAFNVLIPKKSIRKSRPRGGQSYRKKYWHDFPDSDSYLYSRKLTTITNSATVVSASPVPSGQKIYAEVKLAEDVRSKSTRPSQIWKESRIEVVASSDSSTFTISGKKRDFEKLENILGACSFNLAKTDNSTKDVQISREVYSIKDLNPKITGVEKRVDREITKVLADNNNTNIRTRCIIDLYSDERQASYESRFDSLSTFLGDDNVKKRNTELMHYSLTFEANLTNSQIRAILENPNFAFIQKIKRYPEMSAERCLPSTILDTIIVGEALTEEVVGIIDSGVNSALFNPLCKVHYRHLPSTLQDDKDHGTFVTSRVLFGDKIFAAEAGGALQPSAKFVDIQVLGVRTGCDELTLDLDKFTAAIEEAVRRHPEISIYNLSIGNNFPIDPETIDEITSFLDYLARENDILFVCAAGNQCRFMLHNTYKAIFKDEQALISAPADALNVLTVGSVAAVVSDQSICDKKDFPSPFTRKGGMRGAQKKPELVTSGGNLKRDASGIYLRSFTDQSNLELGVEGYNTSGHHKNIGTSFSAPLVTNQCIYLSDYIRRTGLSSRLNLKSNKANLIKALMIHSTARTEQSDIIEKDQKHAYGFGLPDYTKALSNDEHEITMVYCDTISYEDKVHKLDIALPEELLNKKVEYIFTVVYNPPVDPNFPNTYKMIDLKPNIRQIVRVVDELTGEIKEKPAAFSVTSNWENYKNRNFNTVHYRARQSRVTKPWLQAIITMTVDKEYENSMLARTDEIKQPYSFVLTIIDKSRSINLLNSAKIQEQFEQLVEVENEITIEVPGQ